MNIPPSSPPEHHLSLQNDLRTGKAIFSIDSECSVDKQGLTGASNLRGFDIIDRHPESSGMRSRSSDEWHCLPAGDMMNLNYLKPRVHLHA